MNDIKRKTELWLVAQLTAAIPGERFLPAKGGGESTDGADILPPFTIVEAESAERMLPSEPTYQVAVTLTRYAHFADTTSPQHSESVRRIIDALVQLPSGPFEAQALNVHGSYFSDHEEGPSEDGEDAAHTDRLNLSVGCSG